MDLWPRRKQCAKSTRRTPVDAPCGTWQEGATTFEYKRMSRADVLCPGTGWDHVFAVMRTLAGRFGDDDVRLVAWFD
jgi:hypothetical protein